MLYTNHLPRVGASDRGIWRRLIVIPFNAVITGDSDIKNYSKYLLEYAGPAIMQWILDGAREAIQAEYAPPVPESVEAANASYHGDNDWLAHFLDECCDVDPSLSERSGELYAAYRAYCLRTGEYPRSNADFVHALRQRGFERERKSFGYLIYGLALRRDDEPLL